MRRPFRRREAGIRRGFHLSGACTAYGQSGRSGRMGKGRLPFRHQPLYAADLPFPAFSEKGRGNCPIGSGQTGFSRLRNCRQERPYLHGKFFAVPFPPVISRDDGFSGNRGICRLSFGA
ncbi:MAG: hypothetical protein C6W56_16155 [Caldibacillus debilis]|nr:MAG: hypothetical protein C6W56_16155 [Caldibacillus debilis]